MLNKLEFTKLEAELFKLASEYGDMLKVTFISQNEKKTHDESKTRYQQNHGYVSLVLVEPNNANDLNDWADAMVWTSEKLYDMSMELAYEENHPNPFKAIEAKYCNLKRFGKCFTS